MKYVITGADGQLGLAFREELAQRGDAFHGTDLSTCDITCAEAVARLLDEQRPDVLINCAAYNLVDKAEQSPAAAFAVNSSAVGILARACRARRIVFVHYSTDYVFDGNKGELYTEQDAPKPLNVYGRSKLEGEIAACELTPDHLVLRTSWVYGQGRQNFLYKVSEWAGKNRVLRFSADEVSVPTCVDDLVLGTLAALGKGLRGLYHLTSSGYASRYEFAKCFLESTGSPVLAVPVPLSAFAPVVPRPLFSAMSSDRIKQALGITIPSWREGVGKYVAGCKGRQA